jgi:hypothetical protein
MKSIFAEPNSFLVIILQLPIHFNSSAPKLISWQAGVSKLESVLFAKSLLFNHFGRTTLKTQPLCCWEDGSYWIVAYVFVAAGMCSTSRCRAMDVYDFTIPTFGRHVIVFLGR